MTPVTPVKPSPSGMALKGSTPLASTDRTQAMYFMRQSTPSGTSRSRRVQQGRLGDFHAIHIREDRAASLAIPSIGIGTATASHIKPEEREIDLKSFRDTSSRIKLPHREESALPRARRQPIASVRRRLRSTMSTPILASLRRRSVSRTRTVREVSREARKPRHPRSPSVGAQCPAHPRRSSVISTPGLVIPAGPTVIDVDDDDDDDSEDDDDDDCSEGVQESGDEFPITTPPAPTFTFRPFTATPDVCGPSTIPLIGGDVDYTRSSRHRRTTDDDEMTDPRSLGHQPRHDYSSPEALALALAPDQTPTPTPTLTTMPTPTSISYTLEMKFFPSASPDTPIFQQTLDRNLSLALLERNKFLLRRHRSRGATGTRTGTGSSSGNQGGGQGNSTATATATAASMSETELRRTLSRGLDSSAACGIAKRVFDRAAREAGDAVWQWARNV